MKDLYHVITRIRRFILFAHVSIKLKTCLTINALNHYPQLHIFLLLSQTFAFT